MKAGPKEDPTRPADPRRRDVLRALTVAFGATAAARLATPVLFSATLARADLSDAPSPPRILSASQLNNLEHVCRHVIPATDTAGAAELGVHRFVDFYLAEGVSDEDREDALHALDAIEREARSRGEAGFAAMKTSQQRTLLEDLEAERAGFDAQDKWPFKKLKNWIVFAYCTTEVGARELLAWDPYPGGYTGSIPYASVGKAWFS